MQDQNKKTSPAVKNTLSASERFFKKITQSRLKYASRGYFTFFLVGGLKTNGKRNYG